MPGVGSSDRWHADGIRACLSLAPLLRATSELLTGDVVFETKAGSEYWSKQVEAVTFDVNRMRERLELKRSQPVAQPVSA